MRFFIRTIIAFLLLAPVQAYAQDQRLQVLNDNMDMAQKLEDIAAPVLVKNPALCGTYTAHYIGAEFMTTEGVGKSYKELVQKHYGVSEYPTVTIVGKGSPAHGKLLIKDILVSLNGEKLKTGHDGQDQIIQAIHEGKKLDLVIKRAEGQHQITVTPKPVCGAKVRLDASGEDKVWAEKGKVFVSKGALKKRSADALSSEIKTQLGRYKQ